MLCSFYEYQLLLNTSMANLSVRRLHTTNSQRTRKYRSAGYFVTGSCVIRDDGYELMTLDCQPRGSIGSNRRHATAENVCSLWSLSFTSGSILSQTKMNSGLAAIREILRRTGLKCRQTMFVDWLWSAIEFVFTLKRINTICSNSRITYFHSSYCTTWNDHG